MSVRRCTNTIREHAADCGGIREAPHEHDSLFNSWAPCLSSAVGPSLRPRNMVKERKQASRRTTQGEAVWAEIRHLYSTSWEPLPCIAARYGVAVRTILYHAAREKWPRRRDRRGRTAPLCAHTDGSCSETLADLSAQPGTQRSQQCIPDEECVPESGGDWEIPPPLPAFGPATGQRLALRLYRLMLKKIEKMEQKLDQPTALSPADSEREAREIAAMARTLEKVKALARAAAVPASLTDLLLPYRLKRL